MAREIGQKELRGAIYCPRCSSRAFAAPSDRDGWLAVSCLSCGELVGEARMPAPRVTQGAAPDSE